MGAIKSEKRKKPKQKSPQSAKFGKMCLKIGKILRGLKITKGYLRDRLNDAKKPIEKTLKPNIETIITRLTKDFIKFNQNRCGFWTNTFKENE